MTAITNLIMNIANKHGEVLLPQSFSFFISSYIGSARYAGDMCFQTKYKVKEITSHHFCRLDCLENN